MLGISYHSFINLDLNSKEYRLLGAGLRETNPDRSGWYESIRKTTHTISAP